MSDDNKEVRRTTSIRFEHEGELEECFSEFGIVLKEEETDTTYYDEMDNEKLDSWTVRVLRKHSIPVREETKTYMTTRSEALQEIKDQFKLDCSLGIYSYSISMTTYNLTARQHKSMVRRLLHPIRLKGYKVKYDCTQRVEESVCPVGGTASAS